MSEKMNEDNCVLDNDELFCIDLTFDGILKHIKPECKQFKKERLNMIYQKITKLNEMAKQAKDKINHNDYIRHDTAPF